MNATPPPADSSRVTAALFGLAIAAGLALTVATFSDVITVTLPSGRELAAASGADRHGLALLLLAAGCLGLGVLAFQGVRAAAAGLLLIGLAIVLIVVLGDVPDLHTTGRIAGAAEDARTQPAGGFYLESLGGVLALLAGGGFLLTGSNRT